MMTMRMKSLLAGGLRLFGRGTIAISIALPVAAQAGIRITGHEGNDNQSIVAIEGDMARIDNSTQDGFILIDMTKEKIYAVSNREKQVVDLTSPAPEPSAHAEQAIEKVGMPQVVMQPMGAGPVVSGYPTAHYRVMVNDTVCYDEYLAMAPLDNAALMRFVRTMARASRTEKNDFLSIAMDESNLCKVADNLVDDQYPTLGIPMQTVGTDRQVTHQINAIDENVAFDGDFFRWPESYPVYTRRQLQDMSYARMKASGASDPAVAHREQAISDMIKQHGETVVKDLSDSAPEAPTAATEEPAPSNGQTDTNAVEPAPVGQGE